MRYSSRKCACRRELNSHDAAEPREVRHLSLHASEQVVAEQSPIRANLCRCLVDQARGRNGLGKPSAKRHETAVPNRTTGLRWKHWFSVSSSGRRSQQCQRWPERVRRLERVASHGHQRGAGSGRGGPSKVTGPCQAHRQRSPRAVLPNPSLKRSANGRPPGPVWRYAVHFRQPGPGVLPLSPA